MDSAALERLYATLPPIARRPPLEALIAPERREWLRRARWNWRGTLRRLWSFEVARGRTFGLTRNYRFLARAWPSFLKEAERLGDTDLTTLTDDELDVFLGKVWELALSVAPQCEVAVLYYAHDLKLLLAGVLERWCGDGERRYSSVSAGLAHSETVRETDSIWMIAERLRNAGEPVVSAASSNSWQAFRAMAGMLGVSDVVSDLESFLRQHRHRGASYKDLIHPRWADDPELLWNHVRAFLGGHSPRPTEVNARGALTRTQSQQAALAAVRGVTAPFKRRILRWLFRGNEIYAGIRDNHRFYYDHVWWLVRRVYLEKGRRLEARGLLPACGDVMFVSRADVPTDASRNRMAGLSASPGQARGKARIVRDAAELPRVADGEILVARQTDPGWTPAFARLGGLVLETGGVLAHGASLCREYGLPCVTAVTDATRSIADGEIIVVNGSHGWVELPERQ
jgi:pyruvate,water dikinase